MALNYVSVAKKILVVAPLPQGALPVMRYRREHEYDMIGKFNMEIFERLNKKKITAVCEVYTMDNWDYTDPKNDICFEVQTGLSHWRVNLTKNTVTSFQKSLSYLTKLSEKEKKTMIRYCRKIIKQK